MFAFSTLLKRSPQDHSYAAPGAHDSRDSPPSFGELLAAAHCAECCIVPFEYLLGRERDIRPDDLENDGRR